MSDDIGPKFINPNKKYGLILPGKTNVLKPAKVVKPCVFDDDDLDETGTVEKTKVNTSDSRIKRQTQINIEKALQEDPNIFDYDGVYEKLEEEKEKLNPKLKNKSQEPKYIAGLLKAAAARQIEYERRQDRKIQKEREEEGDIFGDKESFVTENYRKRMEERQRLEEEERNQDKIEALFDVTKRKDLSGFYDSLLKMKSGELVIEEEGEKQKRLEREELERQERLKKEEEFSKKSSTKKTFRARKEEEEESSEEEPEPTKQDEQQKDDETESKELKEPETKKAKIEEPKKEEIKEKPKEEKKVEQEPPKIIETKAERWARLFNKRCVGKLYDQEVADYFRRKNEILIHKMHIERD